MTGIGRPTATVIGIGSLLGLANDLLEPIRAMSLWIVLVAVFAIVIALLAGIFPILGKILGSFPVPLTLSEHIKALGVSGVISSAVIIAVITIACNFFTVKNQDEGGVLAASIPKVREWQVAAFGIEESLEAIQRDVSSISQTNKEIGQSVDELNVTSDTIAGGVDELVDNSYNIETNTESSANSTKEIELTTKELAQSVDELNITSDTIAGGIDEFVGNSKNIEANTESSANSTKEIELTTKELAQSVDELNVTSDTIAGGINEFVGNSKNIEANTESSANSTKEIELTTKELTDKADNFKQEISSNPRKELANMQIGWNIESYRNAMTRGDIQTIELFIAGGMNLDNTLAALDIVDGQGNTVSKIFQLSSADTIIQLLTLLKGVGVDLTSDWMARHNFLTTEGDVKSVYEYTSFIREAAIHSNETVILYLIDAGVSINNHPYSRLNPRTAVTIRQDDCSLIASLLNVPKASMSNEYNHIDFLIKQGAEVDGCAKAVATAQLIPLFMIGPPLIEDTNDANKIMAILFNDQPPTLSDFRAHIEAVFDKEINIRDKALAKELERLETENTSFSRESLISIRTSDSCRAGSDKPSCPVRYCSLAFGRLLCEMYPNLVQKSYYMTKDIMGWY